MNSNRILRGSVIAKDKNGLVVIKTKYNKAAYRSLEILLNHMNKVKDLMNEKKVLRILFGRCPPSIEAKAVRQCTNCYHCGFDLVHDSFCSFFECGIEKLWRGLSTKDRYIQKWTVVQVKKYFKL